MKEDRRLPTAPHALAVKDLIPAVATDANAGLSGGEAAERMARHGRNELAKAPLSRGGGGLRGSSRTC